MAFFGTHYLRACDSRLAESLQAKFSQDPAHLDTDFKEMFLWSAVARDVPQLLVQIVVIGTSFGQIPGESLRARCGGGAGG